MRCDTYFTRCSRTRSLAIHARQLAAFSAWACTARNRTQNHSVSGDKSQSMRTSAGEKDAGAATEGQSRIKPRSRYVLCVFELWPRTSLVQFSSFKQFAMRVGDFCVVQFFGLKAIHWNRISPLESTKSPICLLVRVLS